jgi:hypothetical protein
MMNVQETVEQKRERLRVEARRKLINNAIATVGYLADSRVMRSELALTFGVNEQDVAGIITRVGAELTEEIHRMI